MINTRISCAVLPLTASKMLDITVPAMADETESAGAPLGAWVQEDFKQKDVGSQDASF